jgi:hypothetical protein
VSLLTRFLLLFFLLIRKAVAVRGMCRLPTLRKIGSLPDVERPTPKTDPLRIWFWQISSLIVTWTIEHFLLRHDDCLHTCWCKPHGVVAPACFGETRSFRDALTLNNGFCIPFGDAAKVIRRMTAQVGIYLTFSLLRTQPDGAGNAFPSRSLT